jgi:hypothetical protein
MSMFGDLWPEMVMPLPPGALAPLSRMTNEPCCYDCAAAEGLWRAVFSGPNKYGEIANAPRYDQTWFHMARVAVGNDRCDQERLPGIPKGLAYYGLIAPSQPGDWEAHMDWLRANGVRTPWDEDEDDE